MSFNEARKLMLALNEFKGEISNMVADMGNIAYNQTMQSFRDQGFTDENLIKWAARKKADKKGGRGILIGTATGQSGMRASYRKVRLGSFSIAIRNDKVYSGVHNEGLMSGRGRGFKMKERRMIGNSGVMNRKIASKLNIRIRKIWPN